MPNSAKYDPDCKCDAAPAEKTIITAADIENPLYKDHFKKQENWPINTDDT